VDRSCIDRFGGRAVRPVGPGRVRALRPDQRGGAGGGAMSDIETLLDNLLSAGTSEAAYAYRRVILDEIAALRDRAERVEAANLALRGELVNVKRMWKATIDEQAITEGR
jgi:hypothetical protein